MVLGGGVWRGGGVEGTALRAEGWFLVAVVVVMAMVLERVRQRQTAGCEARCILPRATRPPPLFGVPCSFCTFSTPPLHPPPSSSAEPAVKAGVVTGGNLQTGPRRVTHAGMSADAVRAMAEARDKAAAAPASDASGDAKKTE